MSHSSGDLQKEWEGLEAGTEDESAEVSVAGRIMTRRVFGKLAFFNMQARTIKILCLALSLCVCVVLYYTVAWSFPARFGFPFATILLL